MLNRDLESLLTDRVEKPGRVYFVHIRKTGGTSLNHMFLSLEACMSSSLYAMLSAHYKAECNGRKYAGWDRSVIAGGDYYYGFSHHPVYSLQIPAPTFVFSCFRDPVKRVLSLYNMLRLMKDENSSHPGMKEQGPWLGDSFSDFLERAPYREIANQLFMFSHRFDLNEAVDRVGQLSYFFFTDQFMDGVAELNEKLGIGLAPIHVRKSSKKYVITDNEMTRLKEMLKPEYQFISKIQELHKSRFTKEYSSL